MTTRDSAALVLASASPRRADLLDAAGIAFDVIAADVDETLLDGESADAYVRRVAVAKAEAVAARGERRAILAADTTVVVDGNVLGKPVDDSDARRMLNLLSGRAHVVMTGVILMGPGTSPSKAGTGRRLITRVSTTAVTVARLTTDEIDWYVSTGEPLGKAGGYAIQGFASRFVTRIDGSYSNVVGLPVAEVWAMCSELGILVS